MLLIKIWNRLKSFYLFQTSFGSDCPEDVNKTIITQTFMNDKFFFLNEGKVYFKKRILIQAIGEKDYLKWKHIDRIFSIDSPFSAADFVVYIYMSMMAVQRNQTFIKHVMKRFCITEEWLATTYCTYRKIELNIVAGNYRANYSQDKMKFLGVDLDPKDQIAGYGPNVMMALGDLNFEMSFLTKTIIP